MKRFWARYPLDPREKSKARRGALLALTVAGLACAAFCLGAASLLFATLNFGSARFSSYFRAPMLAFLNILPVALLAFFLFFLTNRAWLAFFLSSAVVLIASFANYFKVVLRDDYLTFEDAKLAGAIPGIIAGYPLRLNGWFWGAIAACVLLTAALFFLCRGRLASRRRQFVAAAAVLAAALVSFLGWYTDGALYGRLGDDVAFDRSQPTQAYASRGFVYPFVRSAWQMHKSAPEGYSDRTAEEELAAFPDGSIPDGQKVDVICVMLESFSDFSEFDSIDFTDDPYAPLRKIWAESECGTLISDTMGGGTVNAERSFLTGFAWPQPAYRHATASYVRWFAAQGYATEGAHPGHDWFYNRKNINKRLGFSHYYFRENLFGSLTDMEYAKDDVFFPAVRQLYDARDADTPYFAFHVSYQNHSPYSETEMNWPDTYVNQDVLSGEAYHAVNNYLGGVADTARQAAAFTNGFQKEKAPVVLVFFGDHKPTLGSGNAAYQELGVNMDRSTGEGFRNYYATPYWIWMNDAAKEALDADPAGKGPTISPCYLMCEVLARCGWTGPAFAQFMTGCEQDLPVIHSSGVFLENGTYPKEISEKSQKPLEKFRILQYYLKKKTQE